MVAPPNPSGQASWLRSWKPFGLVAGIGGLTMALGTFRLGAKSIWTDEAFSDAMARLNLGTMWRAIVHGDAFNGLYYTLLHFWQFGGESETWLRLPSVMFGLLATYALFSLNRRLFGTEVGLISAVLLAVNAFFVYYEQDARPYTLALLLVVLATDVFVRAVEHRSTGRWLVYGLVAATAIYAHVFSVFVVGAHVVSVFFRSRRPRLRDMAVGFGVATLLVAPLMAVILHTDSLERRFIDAVHLGSFRWLFLNLTGAGGVPSGGGILLLYAYFATCCLAVLWMLRAALRRKVEETDRVWLYALVLSWLAVPILGSFVVSLVRSPIFYPRYLIVALPPLVTITGIGIEGLRHRSQQFLAFVVLVSLSITPLVSYYRSDFKEGEDWRSAANLVIQGAQPGDGILFLSRYGRRPFEYYLRRSERETELRPIYPSMPWGGYVPVLSDTRVESTTTAAVRLASGYRRVWVVLLWEGLDSVDENAAPFRTALDRYYREVTRRVFGQQLQVRLYQRADA
jgi:mannosyltransferase